MGARSQSTELLTAGEGGPGLLAGDRELLDAFRRGDREALARVYHHYVDAVARLVRYGFLLETRNLRISGARDVDAENEIIQDVFVRAFGERARLGYDGIRPYRPYLLRIAKNLLVDQARSRGHAMLALSDDADEVDDAPTAVDTDED